VFPWNYGFHWNSAVILFLGAFYTVLIVVATTVLSAMMNARRKLAGGKYYAVRWHSDFEDLPPEDRVCRHVLNGEFQERICQNGFDCRHCATHNEWVQQHPVTVPAEREEEIFGLSFPLDRFYHRGHTWARLEPDGTMTVGLDDLARRVIGKPDRVELPEPGAEVHANGVAFRVQKRNADVRVLSPMDGEVVETGGPDRPWFLRIRPKPLDVRHLLRDSEVRPWVMRELERLQLALSQEGAPATLADGGVPVEDIAAAYPDADWNAVCGEMFLQG